MMRADLYTDPIPGVEIIGPAKNPLPGEIVIGYELIDTNKKTLVMPHPKRMNKVGWMAVLVTALCFWPAACVPCCLGCSYSRVQRPVYAMNPYAKKRSISADGVGDDEAGTQE